MKKKVLMALCMLVAVSGFTFANGQSEDDSNKKETVTIVSRDASGFTEWFAQSMKDFDANNENYVSKLNKIPSGEADYNTKTVLMLQTDSSVDIMVVDSFLIPSLVETGILAPLDVDNWDEWESQFAKNVRDGMTIDGKVYGIPFDSDTRGLFYNVDVFESAGISIPWAPKSWQDVLETVKVLNAAGVEYPIWINGSKAQGEATTMQTFEMILSGTNDWIYEDGKWVISSDGFTDSLKFIQDLYDAGIYSNSNLAEMLDANAYRLVTAKMTQKNEIGILLDGHWKGGDWIKEFGETATDKIKVTPMPNQAGDGFTSMSGGWVLAVSNLSKNKDAAFEFIKSASSYESTMALCTNSGEMTVRADVMDKSEYVTPDPYRAEMSYYTSFTHFRPGVDVYPSVSIEIQNAVESVITGQATAEEAAASYAKNVKSLVGADNCIEK
jgi:multiple sugar transport system substrate-binding protein